ncbi:response regulator transcription factor [Tsukamurella tyrosinosolvens]|uniref:DNA-binding response regulator, NarL/FixJ family, contains REC and HTH domains n=1 Tax=Tsukamurella tyrosinosolvens TaxID=57704 RepID=A0A1H4Z9I2_TSUTY|nr:response regulator transcription factor [Tsukamurella tyrosinosolvens]AUN41674.1 DNA-binding response regulator [Tsukamurella tyrosinosolvens]MCA4994419.1 response regulator transcription factor [Tsukamurella tyrosinosolvens]MEC4611962.1 response regulator transcription factor [Tsukamurella tyrosinosolvens]QRY84443.1 response regulator transcription factor [Tsukamurella tyrosinosolvens]RDB48411.1 DNA-binding response regulator [Tsukamurella tyrosinosolvens]
MTIRVVLADDQEMVRIGFAMILGAAPDMEVVGQASDGVEAVAVIAETRPDVALLDIRMPRLDGIEVSRRVVESATRVVIVTTFGEPDYVDAALGAGASGFLLKDAGPDLLIAAVRAAATGDALISPELTVDLLARSRASGRRDAAAAATLAELTAREREVAQCVARGRTNAEIADELVISLGTVKTHLGAITRRLGARNRVEVAAAMWAAGEMD